MPQPTLPRARVQSRIRLKIPCCFTLSPDVVAIIDRQAKRGKMSKTAWVEDAIRRAVAK